MSWDASTSQIHHLSNHLTLPHKKKENFQSIEKHRKYKYTCSFSLMQAFLFILVPKYDGVFWKHRPCHACRIKRLFLLATLNPSFFDFNYIWDFEFLMLRFCRCLTSLKQDALYATCYVAHICMTDMTSLISFFLILFHYWAALVAYQQNRVNNTTSSSLINIFSGWVFSGLLTDRGTKMPTSIKSVTHILQWWNLARLYLT